ncbi:MAG TPA: S1 RNA-binding domain-containing protein [Anaerolineae bacterium]|nr:S1 RNA-binding domain-containing protein [Anaerolineae bacterium]
MDDSANPSSQEAAPAERSQPPSPMSEWLGEAYEYRMLQHGEIVEGTVVHVSPGEILIDVGSKSEGLVSPRELERMAPEELAKIRVGDRVPVFVVTPEDHNGNIVLSLTQAQLEKDWQAAQVLYSQGEIFEGVVASYNRGGLIVHLGKVRGFVPSSQLARHRYRGETREELLSALVGEKLWLKIIECDRNQNRLILSEEAAERQRRKEQREQLLEELREGDIRRGTVISLANFGAFVNLGGADGLIHLSELSWCRVSHPSEVLKVGDEVEVYVLSIDRERCRIGLSLKRLQPEPWETVHERYSLGQLVTGTITKLTDFGAFARLEGDIEGLIHISELSDEPIHHPREVVKEGEVVPLRIIRIDRKRKRLGLSLKRVREEEAAESEEQGEDEEAEDTEK